MPLSTHAIYDLFFIYENGMYLFEFYQSPRYNAIQRSAYKHRKYLFIQKSLTKKMVQVAVHLSFLSKNTQQTLSN